MKQRVFPLIVPVVGYEHTLPTPALQWALVFVYLCPCSPDTVAQHVIGRWWGLVKPHHCPRANSGQVPAEPRRSAAVIQQTRN